MSQDSSSSSASDATGGSGHDPASIQLILDAINDDSPANYNDNTCSLPASASNSGSDKDLAGTDNGNKHVNTRASPPADIFRNLRNAQRFSIDIGGSLAKIAYFSKVLHRRVKINEDRTPVSASGDNEEYTYEVLEGARLHFIKFETQYIEECLDFVQKRLMGSIECMRGKCVKVTGGGAYKYSALIQEKLGITPDKEDEIGCLIKGANFLLKNVANEAFSYERKREPEYQFMQAGPVLFPYLLVNIGSGVSILKVDSETEFQRVGGTATGGGTFWGLGKLLTGAKEFDELLELAEAGDNRNVDLLVKDIYSRDYAQMGLPGDLIASSFGKATYSSSSFKPADLARSLLFTIANDIGQIACLFALQHKLSRIYFGGYFLRNHPLSMSAVSYSVQFWSKRAVEALFLRHEGYLGAIGAFLRGTEELESDKYSWSENFSGSSGCLINGVAVKREKDPAAQRPFFRRASIEQLEIDRLDQPVGFFPLLSTDQSYIYTPDTVDLTNDSEARVYWLTCFEGWIEKITSRAIESQPNHPTTADRAVRCRHKLQSRLKLLHRFPCAFGTLTVRSLLDTVEQSLRESDFPDPYFSQKQTENQAALAELGPRLAYIDSLPADERERELILGVLAGNVFDWGAKAVTQLLEGPDLFGFEEAKQKIRAAPWVVDCMDAWQARLATGPPHKCVAIFVDNSGVDFVLGILPFAREFLKRDTRVILCPNSHPAVNDITYPEMVALLVNQIASICPVLGDALQREQLQVVSTGQASPCLDLSRVSHDLIAAVQENETDLVVIEGMGRSIHTNLNAQFRVDVLKMAVIKNAWLAERLGGELYSALVKYEKPRASQ